MIIYSFIVATTCCPIIHVCCCSVKRAVYQSNALQQLSLPATESWIVWAALLGREVWVQCLAAGEAGQAWAAANASQISRVQWYGRVQQTVLNVRQGVSTTGHV